MESINNPLKNFDSVWQRVTAADDAAPAGSARAAAMDDRAALQKMIQKESDSMTHYTCLAARTRGQTARFFSRLAAAERGHLKRLQLEYLLLTGDSYRPAAYVCPKDGNITLVRIAYMDEAAAEKGYLEAARRTESDSLRKIYLAHSSDEAEHGRMLRGLLLRSMG